MDVPGSGRTEAARVATPSSGWLQNWMAWPGGPDQASGKVRPGIGGRRAAPLPRRRQVPPDVPRRLGRLDRIAAPGNRRVRPGACAPQDGLPVPGVSAICASAACRAFSMLPARSLAWPAQAAATGTGDALSDEQRAGPGPSFGSFAEVGKLADRRASRPVRCFRIPDRPPEIALIPCRSAPETAPHVPLRAVCLIYHPRTERERRLSPCLQGSCRQRTGKHSERKATSV